MTTIQYINNDWFQDEFKMARHRLEGDMEIAYEDYKTQLLREGPFYLYLSLYSGRGNRWTILAIASGIQKMRLSP